MHSNTIETLKSQRAQIENRRAVRHAEHEKAQERERAKFKGAPEAHVKIAISNAFGMGTQGRRRLDEEDARQIRNINAQISRLIEQDDGGPRAA